MHTTPKGHTGTHRAWGIQAEGRYADYTKQIGINCAKWLRKQKGYKTLTALVACVDQWLAGNKIYTLGALQANRPLCICVALESLATTNEATKTLRSYFTLN